MYVLLSTVNTGTTTAGGVMVAKDNDHILIPITTSLPLAGYDIPVSCTSMLAPGVRVWPPFTKAEEASAV